MKTQMSNKVVNNVHIELKKKHCDKPKRPARVKKFVLKFPPRKRKIMRVRTKVIRPKVNVAPPSVSVAPPEVNVAPPVVNVAPPNVQVEAPEVNVFPKVKVNVEDKKEECLEELRKQLEEAKKDKTLIEVITAEGSDGGCKPHRIGIVEKVEKGIFILRQKSGHHDKEVVFSICQIIGFARCPKEDEEDDCCSSRCNCA